MRVFSLRAIICASLALAAFLVAPTGASAFGYLGGVNPIGGGPSADKFQLDGPNAIVRVPDGLSYSFYVADTSNYRIVKLDSAGNFVMSFGGSDGGAGSVSAPRSIAYSGDCEPGSGTTVPCLYVTEAYLVKRFSLSGQLLSSWGGSGSGDGQFNNAAGIAVDPTWGYVAVADRQNNRVQRFTPTGTWVETIGQGSGPSDSTPGHLLSPAGVAFDSNGRLWVVDTRGGYGYVNYYGRQGSSPFTYSYEGRVGGGVCSSCADFMPGVRGIFADVTGVGANRVWAATYWDVAEPNFRSHLFRITGDASSAAPYTVSGPWGTTGTPGSGSNDLYGANQPFADGDSLWVPESINNRIHLYGSALSTPTSSGTWGKSADTDGYLRNTTRLAAAPDGSVFAWDAYKYRIQHFSASGEFINAFGGYENDDPFIINQGVSGMAVRENGELLVSDAGHLVIKRFSAAGDYLGSIALPQDQCGSEDVYPGPLTIDAAGRIYMYDYGNSCVVVMDDEGDPIAHFGQPGSNYEGNELYAVQDIAANPAGTSVFVLDFNRVKEFSSSDGTTWTGHPATSTSLGTGTAIGEFSQPQGLGVDPTDGSVYVSDQYNNRVQRAVVSGHSYTWSAFGTRGYDPEKFQRPQGLAVDPGGNVWISDLDSDSIKRYGDAPDVTILSPVDGSSTLADSTFLEYDVTDPAADCSIDSGSTVALNPGSNTITVTCTNDEGSDTESVTIDMHEAPQVTNLASSETSPTTASSTILTWSTSGTPVPSCAVNGNSASSGASVSLAGGDNIFTVVCTNAAGSDSKSVTVTRNVPPVPAVPSIKFPKKLKLSSTGKLTFNVICQAGCQVTGKIKIGSKKTSTKSAKLSAQQGSQQVSLKVSSSLAKKIREAHKKKKAVNLTVTVLAYGAKQGKTGSAIVRK